MKEVTIVSGIKRSEIHDYLVSLGAVVQGNLYQSSYWSVELSPESTRTLGSITLPQTTVIFKGDATVCDKLVEDYRLYFLSAGA